jgi:LmbE family N-acetylglucosaminyl deacetylase
MVFGSLVAPALAQQATPSIEASPGATPVAGDETATPGEVDLDVLFIGAHPDDEAFGLAAYGQWNEFDGVSTGVITVTRGEGGGNAVGTEEGPALGLLREAEERDAVSVAGIEHIYNLDKVDFYYTVSAPLTIQTWDYEDTLERVVRVVRATTPDVIITMNPAATPGNHGHHQVAARLAIDAFDAAADPERFPHQVNDEGYDAWSVGSIYQNGAAVESTPGENCATSFVPADPTQTIFGVWQGTISEQNGGRSWGEVARDGQRTYASQGWAVFPDAPTDPAEIACNYFTLIDTRVAISTNPDRTTAMLENAVIENRLGLPLGTEFYLTTDAFNVLPGDEFTVTATARVPEGLDASASSFALIAPVGWEIVGAEELEAQQADPEAEPAYTVAEDGTMTQEFTIIPAADAEAGARYRIGASFAVDGGVGVTNEVVEIAPAVGGVLAPLPEIAQFQEWTAETGQPQLNSLILPVTSIGSGGTTVLDINLTNNTAEAQSGSVTLTLPEGFSAEPAEATYELGANESSAVQFTVTNTDASLATSNEGGEEGTYAFTVTTESAAGTSTTNAGLNLVPVSTVPQAGADIAVDGTLTDGEYAGESLDLSRIWEGQELEGEGDASGNAWVAWSEDGLYVAVEVTDDTLGTILTPEDAKRHWRTDSVEIAVDPLGTAPNTSATFKVGVFPTSTDGSPQAYRDADAWQGPVSETAPGFEVASTLTEPYTGYVMETFIPFESLPADIDPNNAALNIFIYDSDTEDLTGQTRLGWSTWNGVQGDPYRWGQVTLDGFDGAEASPVADVATPVADGATPVAETAQLDEPIMPLEVAQSTQSPLSIAQSAADGVPLAGRTPVPDGQGLTFLREPTLAGSNLMVAFEAASNGTVNYFLVQDDGTIVDQGQEEIFIGKKELTVGGLNVTGQATLLISFETEAGEVQAFAFPLGG